MQISFPIYFGAGTHILYMKNVYRYFITFMPSIPLESLIYADVKKMVVNTDSQVGFIVKGMFGKYEYDIITAVSGNTDDGIITANVKKSGDKTYTIRIKEYTVNGSAWGEWGDTGSGNFGVELFAVPAAAAEIVAGTVQDVPYPLAKAVSLGKVNDDNQKRGGRDTRRHKKIKSIRTRRKRSNK